MKKSMVVLMVMFVAMLPSMAEAFVYTVEKGDCLSLICQRYKEDVAEVARANGITDPNMIYPGQVIAFNSGGGQSSEVVSENEKSPEVVVRSHSTYTVRFDDTLYHIGRKFGVDWQEIAKANEIRPPYTIYPGDKLIVPASMVEVEKSEPMETAVRNVSQTAISGNPAPQSENYMVKDASMASPPESEMVVAAAPHSYEQGGDEMVMVEEDSPSPYNFGRGDTLEFYFGGGKNWAANPDLRDGDSKYFWGKIRLIPLKFTNFSAGLFVAGAKSDGKSEDEKEGFYEWESKKIYGGLTLRPYGNGWDGAFEAGWGKMWKEGGIRLYESEQNQDIIVLSGNLSLYGRRNRGKNFLPKVEFNGEYIIPTNVEHKHSYNGKPLEPDPYDDKMFAVRGDLWLYDFWLAPNFRVTPGLKGEFGKEWGPDENYWAYGASIQLGTQSWNAVTISYKYKKPESAEREQHNIGGYITFRF